MVCATSGPTIASSMLSFFSLLAGTWGDPVPVYTRRIMTIIKDLMIQLDRRTGNEFKENFLMIQSRHIGLPG